MENDFIPVLELEDENIDSIEEKRDIEENQDIDNKDQNSDSIEDSEDSFEDDEEEEEEDEDSRKISLDEESLVSATFTVLQSKGFLDSENSPKSWDELNELFDTLPITIVENIISNLPEESQDLIDYVINNPTLDKKSLLDFVKRYSEIVDDSEFDDESAKVYLTRVFQNKGLKGKTLEAALERLEDDGELVPTAKEEKDAEKALIAKKLQEEKEADKEAEKKRKDNIKAYWTNVAEELKSTNWKPQKQKEILDFMKSQGVNSTLKEIYNSPKALVQLADILKSYDVNNGTFNTEKLVNKETSKKLNNIKDNILVDAFTSAAKSKSKIKTIMENLEPII
jgi:hypothetical protein